MGSQLNAESVNFSMGFAAYDGGFGSSMPAALDFNAGAAPAAFQTAAAFNAESAFGFNVGAGGPPVFGQTASAATSSSTAGANSSSSTSTDTTSAAAASSSGSTTSSSSATGGTDVSASSTGATTSASAAASTSGTAASDSKDSGSAKSKSSDEKTDSDQDKQDAAKKAEAEKAKANAGAAGFAALRTTNDAKKSSSKPGDDDGLFFAPLEHPHLRVSGWLDKYRHASEVTHLVYERAPLPAKVIDAALQEEISFEPKSELRFEPVAVQNVSFDKRQTGSSAARRKAATNDVNSMTMLTQMEALLQDDAQLYTPPTYRNCHLTFQVAGPRETEFIMRSVTVRGVMNNTSYVLPCYYLQM